MLFIGIIHNVNAAELSKIEIFDSKQEKVVQEIRNTTEIQHEIHKWLQASNRLAVRSTIHFKDEIVFRIPIQPFVKVNNGTLNVTISEIYLILSPKEKPLFLVFTNEDRSFIVYSDYDISLFLDKIQNESPSLKSILSQVVTK